ncbi:MAG: stage 0 sporulation family protein [Firmicutes bacterium]|nr:stage 0 sporulation family protein [Bacillota bacterium]
MTKIVGVRFKPVGKIYHFNPAGLDIQTGDKVIVETARGIEMGSVVIGVREIRDEDAVKPLKDVIRIATPEDMEKAEENSRKEKEAFKICNEKIKKHGLEMKLIEVEYTFDNSKVLFYFTADGRIDFRELVKDLATVFRTRIELRQIGIRDEAKTIGSLGICGRELCCSKFLGEFMPVSIKMAKEQGLSLNPTKISGICGRLMCCLKYEQEAYEELLRITPRHGALVETPDGRGFVEYVDLLGGTVKVKIDTEKEAALKEYDVKDVRILKKGKIKDCQEKIDEELLKKLEE